MTMRMPTPNTNRYVWVIPVWPALTTFEAKHCRILKSGIDSFNYNAFEVSPNNTKDSHWDYYCSPIESVLSTIDCIEISIKIW